MQISRMTEKVITMRYVTSKTALLIALTGLAAFENKSGWKVDADGNLEKDANGNPIYVQSDGREMSVQYNTVARLNDEAKTHREEKEKLQKQIQAFGDLDPDKAKKALETVAKLDAKQLIDNGEVDKVKTEITSQFTEQLKAKDDALNGITGERDTLLKQLHFSRSDFIRNRIAVPQDMFEATFGNNFKVENGKLVPYGNDGNKLMSPNRVGEVATVDEAFELLVNQHTNKDMILRAEGHNGAGSDGGGGNRGGNRTITRADFEKMNPGEQAKAAEAMRKGEIRIT